MDTELVTDPDACMMYIVSPLAGLGGGILWRPPACSLLILPLLHCESKKTKTNQFHFLACLLFQMLLQVSDGYNYNSTSIRRPFDCLSKVIKVTLT